MKAIRDNRWSYKQLWEGCNLAAVAHAVMVAHYPYLSHEHSWDGCNYSMQDNSDCRGTVTFLNGNVVAAFRNNRVPARDKKAVEFFLGATNEVVDIANNETLQYLFEEVNGVIAPVITTGLWGDTNQLFSHDSLESFIKNGGGMLSRQILTFHEAVESWIEYYDMSEGQVELMVDLYQKIISAPFSREIKLTERDVIKIGATDEGSLSESKTSFEELGIQWPSL